MGEIVRLILPFFGLILIGFGAGRLRWVPPNGLAGLNFFVVYLALPALFFRLIATTPAAGLAAWSYVLTTTFSTYCAFAIAFSIGALVNRGNVGEATIEGLIGSYANIGYLAPALVIAAFGPAAAVPTALVFSFDTAMLLALTPLMMALGGSVRSEPKELAERIARDVLLQPLIIATVLGFIAAAIGAKLPGPLDALFATVGSAAAPAALFAFGVGLAQRPVDKLPPETSALIGVKLIIHPLIVYLLLGWVGGFDRMWMHAAVLMAALPPAANVFALAERYRTYAARAASAIALATVISVATVTVVLILLLNDILPLAPFR